MKKILTISLFSLLLVVCYYSFKEGNSKEDNKITTTEEEKDTLIISTTLDSAVDYSNNEVLKESSKYIALVKINKILGTDNYGTIYKRYVFPYTYGTMTILNVYKGSLEINKKVKFYKLGGTLPIEKYYEGLNKTQKEKFDADNQKNQTIDKSALKNVKVIVGKDCDIKENETYLVYLNDETTYHGEEDSYAIVGLEYGIRKVKNVKDNVLTVKNNETGKYETMEIN